jgi:hypothetical protein
VFSAPSTRRPGGEPTSSTDRHPAARSPRLVGGLSIRQVASQMCVRESALRYRLRRQRDGGGRRPAVKPTGLDAYEAAVHAVLTQLDDVRITGEGRPIRAHQIYAVLCRDQDSPGAARAWSVTSPAVTGCRRCGHLRRWKRPGCRRRRPPGSDRSVSGRKPYVAVSIRSRFESLSRYPS